MKIQVLEKTENPEEQVCIAARNDYSDEFVGEVESFAELMADVPGDSLGEKKAGFLKRLLKKGHYGPFEHPHITYMVKGVSRSLMAQITRHRHVTFDVQSQRYVDFSDKDADELIVMPSSIEDVDEGNRDPDKKSLDEIINNHSTADSQEELEDVRELIFSHSIEQSVNAYKELTNLGVPPEDARFVLPIGSKVNMVFTLNARMLMHVADMRAQADAQWEIRQMTGRVLNEAEEWMPNAFAYYRDEMIHRKNRLSP